MGRSADEEIFAIKKIVCYSWFPIEGVAHHVEPMGKYQGQLGGRRSKGKV